MSVAKAAIPSSLPSLVQALRGGQLPLGDYLAHLEARFAEAEPVVQAFVPEPQRFARLRSEASALLADFPDPATRPPLFGVPVGIKDIMHVAGLPTTAGSRLPPEELAGPESAVVTALKRAGALVAGKTVSTEFAYFGPGPTRNPHNPEHTPGGSSSGSAAAVAAGLCPLALGTQTIGSIIRPAAFCGVVGYKPSYERISREGVIPLSPSLDHIGAFAADVAGVALAASLLARDWRPDRPQRRPVLGVPEGPYLGHASPAALDHFRATVQRLAGRGYRVVAVNVMADFALIRERHNAITAADAAQVHQVWYERYRDRYHPKTIELIERGRAVTPEALEAALAGRLTLRDQLTHQMNVAGIDLWLAPAAPGPAPRGLDSTGDPVMNLPWTHAGLPAVSVPAGEIDGLPVGLQLVGRWHADELLLAWAADAEAALRGARD